MPTLIDLKRKFVFVHIPRTGGTSITDSLGGFKKKFPEGLSVLGHDTIHDVWGRVTPEQFESFYKFAVVRNPWEWSVSNWNYIRQNPLHKHHAIMAGLSFRDYVCEFAPTNEPPQWDYLAASNGEPLVDLVGRFEQLDHDWGIFCRAVGLVAHLPKINLCAHPFYRRFYDAETKAAVAKRCAREVEHCGYTF